MVEATPSGLQDTALLWGRVVSLAGLIKGAFQHTGDQPTRPGGTLLWSVRTMEMQGAISVQGSVSEEALCTWLLPEHILLLGDWKW